MNRAAATTPTGQSVHTPVLLGEVLKSLEPRPGGTYVDCTVGAGGHAAAVLERSAPSGRLLGLDADGEILVLAGERLEAFSNRATLVHTNFVDLESVARTAGFVPAD